MSELVSLTTSGTVGVITINNPPVNALSPGVPEGIESCLDRAAADPAIRAVVLIGAGRTFIAGADIHQLAETTSGPDVHDLLKKMEDCPKPLVIAIHGTALGGGLEFAMAGHYRVATADAQVGQPEVNLGIIPGAEGTQRLPRLAGIAKAIDMCVTGAPVKAPDALSSGIVDRIVDGDLLAGAVAFAEEKAAQGGPHPKTSERNQKLGSAAENEPLYAAGRDLARKIRRNQTAPLKAIEAIQAAATLPYEQGWRRERELFNECIVSDQAKALIHAFLAEREVAKVPGITKETPVLPVNRAGIIGAGTMGAGIAMTFANAGIPVWIRDSDASALDRGMANIRKNYESSVKKGRFTAEVMEQRMSLIHPVLTYEGFEQADLIIEAVFESMALKKQIFSEIGGADGVAKADCVLATNSSTLDLDEIAKATARPEKVVGLHFFSPAHVMRLVEIVRGKATGLETLATALGLTKKLRKVGVVVGNCRGFVGNRMMLLYMREAQFLVEEGATPERVDKVLTGWGMAMGIFAVDDMGGLDIAYRIKQEYKHLLKPGERVPLVLDKLVEMGRLGQKTGRGWYIYDENRKPAPDPETIALIEQTAKEAAIERRAVGDDEILDRCIYIMVNEAARILEEGHALRASDIDTIYLAGYGFPAYRGGPMWYADTVGLKKVYERIEEFHRRHGEHWAPAPLLKRLAAEGRTFASLDKEKSERHGRSTTV